MFRNRWGALFFVALTLAGVTTLIGSKDNEGAIKQATDRIARQKAEADGVTGQTQQAPPASASPPETVVLSADEELIDPATGEDPTPIDEFAAPADPNTEVSDDAVILSPDAGGQPANDQFAGQ